MNKSILTFAGAELEETFRLRVTALLLFRIPAPEFYDTL